MNSAPRFPKFGGPAPRRAHGVAQRRLAADGGPLLLADWDQVVFLHYGVPLGRLQPHVPFALDEVNGQAFISLVGFTMRRLRFAGGGSLLRWLCRPLDGQKLLNLRAYVRHEGEAGICFLSEWISSAINRPLGPLVYGLPYHWAQIDYRHDLAAGGVSGRVRARRQLYELRYRAHPVEELGAECEPESLDEFLLERYVAFTQPRRRVRYFRVWHAPWQIAALRAHVETDELLRRNIPWWHETRLIGASFSPGVRDVWMGRPRWGRCGTALARASPRANSET